MIIHSDDGSLDGPRVRRLTPPQTKGVTSVARVADDWYVACRSKQLRKKPRSVTLLGIPLVLFRGANGIPTALLDRCPHRNVPLSLGRVVGSNLQCGYHGWQFDSGGVCRVVPGLIGETDVKARCVEVFPTRELDGFVWVYATPNVEPEREPYRFPLLSDKAYTSIYQTVEVQGCLHAVAENALDVPHTAFLHQGLFRGTGERNEVEVIIRRTPDRVEAEYKGEPRPPGLAGRILAPGGKGEVEHWDRFILPCVVQVEYKLGPKTHFCVTTALTPLEDFRTRMFAVLSFKLPLPGWLVALVLAPVARRIFKQDAVILARQTEAIQQFGGEQFASTEVDVLGQSMLRMLRGAERGDRSAPDDPIVRRFKMTV